MSRNQSPNLTAGGDIACSTFVKLSTAADNTALQAGDGDPIIGISQAGPKDAPGLTASALAANAKDNIEIYGLGDICRLLAGAGGWGAGALLKSDANGAGVIAVSAGSAVALEAAAAGEKRYVQISSIGSPGV